MTASQLPIEVTTEAPVPEAETPEDEERRQRRRKAFLLLFLLGVLIVLLLLTIWYLLFRQPVPLPVIPETQVPHYVNALYETPRPVGVAVNAAGDRIYVAQTGPGATEAVVLDQNGSVLTKMLPPLSTGQDHVPVWLAVDPLTGEVYVSDRPTGSIYIYDASGTYQRQYTPSIERVGWQPMGLAFDQAGNLYVSDLGASPQQVVEFDRSGNVVRTFGAGDNLNFANGIAVDGHGNVYVADSNNGRLLVYDAQGKQVTMVGRGTAEGSLGLPRGVTVDGSGRVFVVDSSGHNVAVYRQYQEGQQRLEYLGLFGQQGVQDGQFMFPNGIAADGHGRLFVADTSNDRVQIWGY